MTKIRRRRSHTPDALWALIFLGPDNPPGTVGRPATPNQFLTPLSLCCVRLSMAGHSAGNLRPRIDRPRSVPTLGTTRRVCPSLADAAGLL